MLAYNSDNADYSHFNDDSCTSAKDSLACIRAVDAAALEIVNGNVNVAGFYGTFVFVPVIDGSFITQRPTEAMKQGKVNGVSSPLIPVIVILTSSRKRFLLLPTQMKA